ncbi:Fe-S cluster assembly iron-binding protein IscA [Streptosporangium becharense]|uniref:Fe-S cluster assembly iron-binding protein IscA n=1 Tax=Streptosporangium becharense TaxID=1816182 RepID=A0A7W9MJY1_9ACTN|nr:Fe-S cluster assembly protein HesB [Streptosporangium becharense]MBB2914428.1 Fe-S cluster assembly iron-binding protein IscA [Streptosporangium becharense]MBB5823540.1 Fe-S cluster assembly iron-binding protein IscA [Streptosporangium becharense]
MLTLTDTAAQVIRDISAQVTDSPETGVRISSEHDGTGSLVLSVVEHPEAADQVVESEGARIFLDPQVVDMLDDKSLDADVDEGGGVAFLVTEQPR